MLNATNIFPIIKGFESNYVETEGFSTVLKCTATYIFVQYKNIAPSENLQKERDLKFRKKN